MSSIKESRYGYSPGIQGIDIRQGDSPVMLAGSAAPMTVGTLIEGPIQSRMILRGITGRRGLSMGGSAFRQWLTSPAAQSMKTVFGNKITPGKEILNLISKNPKLNVNQLRKLKGLGRIEPLYRRFLSAGNTGKVVGTGAAKAIGRAGIYSSSMLISDMIMPVVRATEHMVRMKKLTPLASRRGTQVGSALPFVNWQGKLKGASMQKKSDMGSLGAAMIASTVGSTLSTAMNRGLAERGRNRKREYTIRRNWDRLVNRYPEFNKMDRTERDEVMDIFEGLHAMSPEITDVPVLAAPLLRNALEYGMKGFSAADMKTLTDINVKMSPDLDPGHKTMPKIPLELFGSNND